MKHSEQRFLREAGIHKTIPQMQRDIPGNSGQQDISGAGEYSWEPPGLWHFPVAGDGSEGDVGKSKPCLLLQGWIHGGLAWQELGKNIQDVLGEATNSPARAVATGISRNAFGKELGERVWAAAASCSGRGWIPQLEQQLQLHGDTGGIWGDSSSAKILEWLGLE